MSIDEMIARFFHSVHMESVLNGTNEIFNNAIKNKNDALPIWDKLIIKLKENDIVRGVRNIHYIPISGKFSAGIKDDSKIAESVTVVVGFMINQIGVYYCHDNEKATIPIVDRYKNVYPHLSYYPFNKKQEEFARRIIEQVNIFFPKMELFNNFYASIKAKDVFIDAEIVKEIDFFQLAFHDDMHGFF